MIRSIVSRAILVAIAAGVCWFLYSQLGVWTGLACWMVATATLCIASGAILRRARIGEITWKNRQAAYLLPWGFAIGRGKLPAIVAAAWIGWALIGVGVALATALADREAANGMPPWRWMLLAAWAINVSAMLAVLGVLVKNFTLTSSSGRSLMTIIAVLALLLLGSIALHAQGYTRLATAVAGGPLLIVGIAYSAFVLLIVTVGRNARWN